MTARLRPFIGLALVAASVVLVLTGAYRPVQLPALVGTAVAFGVAALTALIAGLAFIRPWQGLLLFCAAMPVVNVARAQAWIGSVQILPATVVIAALALGVLLQRSATTDGGEWRPPTARMLWVILGAAVVLAVGASLADTASETALNITLHGVLEPLAVFALVVALRPRADRALQALVAIAVGVTLATIINFAWLILLIGPRGLYEQRMLLARLTYFNVGIYADMLVVAIPAAFAALVLRFEFRRPRVLLGIGTIAIGLMVVALFFTYTKSAWLSAALVAALLIVLLVDGWRRRIPLLAVVMVLLALVVPYPLPFLRGVAPDLAAGYQGFLVALQGEGRVESWDPDTYQGSGSISIRLEAVGAAAELTARDPLLGVGPGGFQEAFAEIRPDASVPDLQSAHNLLPNLAAEYGLPFALLVAGGLLWAIRAGLLLHQSQETVPRVVGVALGVALIGFLAMATMFGVDLYRTYRTMNLDVVIVAVLAALSCSITRIGARQTSAGRAGSRTDGRDTFDQPVHLGPADQDELGGARAR